MPSTGGLPLIPPLLNGRDYSQTTYHMNHLMKLVPTVQQQSCHAHKSDLSTQQIPYGGISDSCSHNTAQLQPGPELNFYSFSDSGKTNVQVKKEDRVHKSMNGTTKYTQLNVDDQCQPSVIVKVEKKQSVNLSDPQNNKNMEESKNSTDSKEKDIQSAERKKVSKSRVLNKSSPATDDNMQTASPRCVQRSKVTRHVSFHYSLVCTFCCHVMVETFINNNN